MKTWSADSDDAGGCRRGPECPCRNESGRAGVIALLQLRHTFASTMLSRNAPLLYVQQQGGWRSAGVLLRVYARWMPQDLAPSVTPVAPEVRRVVEATGNLER